MCAGTLFTWQPHKLLETKKKKKNEKENMEEERNGSSATRLQTLRQSSFRDPNNILSPLDLSTLIILTKKEKTFISQTWNMKMAEYSYQFLNIKLYSKC